MLSSIGAADDWDVTASVGSHNNKGIVVTVTVNWAHKIEAFELQQDLARLWGTEKCIYFVSSDSVEHMLESVLVCPRIRIFSTYMSNEMDNYTVSYSLNKAYDSL